MTFFSATAPLLCEKNKNLDIDYAIDDFMIYCQEKIRCIDTTKFSEFGDYTITQIIMDTGMRLGKCLALKEVIN